MLVIGSALVVAFSRNILYSAFALLLTLFGVAGLYVFLQADFLAAAQVLIYVGGILVLILFGVMLPHQISNVNLSNPAVKPWLAGPLVLIILAGLIWIIVKTDWSGPKIWLDLIGSELKILPGPTTQQIGQAIMGKYLLPFEVVSVLLLAALLGAAYLARSRGKSNQ